GVPWQKAPSGKLNDGESEAQSRDVRLVANVGDVVWINDARRGDIGHALVTDPTANPHAIELIGIADHRAPVISSLCNRCGVNKAHVGGTVVAHKLGADRVDCRVDSIAPGHCVELPVWTTQETAAVQ